VGGGSAILDDHESLSEEDDDSLLLEQAPLPYGVRKMEVLSRYMPKPYAAIYLITLFTSLSSTTTPAVEPFLLSLFGGHAYISSIAIITSIAYAVCKPITAKVLDTFGRAEGLAVSALLYGIGECVVTLPRIVEKMMLRRLLLQVSSWLARRGALSLSHAPV
jgi:hypothetical protein